MAVARAAGKQNDRAIQQRFVAVLGRAELVEEVGKLLHEEHFAASEPFEHHRVAVVMGETVARLRDADLGNREPVAFAARPDQRPLSFPSV